MARFAAFLWEPDDLHSSEQAHHFSLRLLSTGSRFITAFNSAGITVLWDKGAAKGFCVYRLPIHAGVILGRLFRAGRTDSAEPLSEANVSIADERMLVSEYWGAYVSLWYDRNKRTHRVIRDCSGQFPCFRASIGNIHFFFSNLEDLRAVSPSRHAVNLPYVAAFLEEPELRIRASALEGVFEILAGESWQLAQGCTRQLPLWNPVEICKRGMIDDYDSAVSHVQRVSQDCIAAWASVDRRILLRLSGGLDSSVVLGSLCSQPDRPEITCVNRFAPAHAEDERRYARLAIGDTGIPLVEIEWPSGPALSLARLTESRQSLPKPTVPWVMLLDLPVTNELVKRYAADAWWTGEGGDHLFLMPSESVYAADYIRTHGIDLNLLRIMSDIARLTGDSYWKVAGAAASFGLIRKDWKTPEGSLENLLLVNRSALPADFATYAQHPWLESGGTITPGKKFHIWLLANLVNRLAPLDDLAAVPERHPLVSQPLIELCLMIPTYLFIRGGRSRGLERDAFLSCLPPEVASRTSKGSSLSFTTGIIRSNSRLLRDYLLDGYLVRERLISQSRIENLFSPGRPIRDRQIYRLLACVVAECWIRGWYSGTEVLAV